VVTGCDYNRPSAGIVGTTNTISITPPTTVKAGRHTLYVRTFDDAHNLSTSTASYTFYISPDLGSTTTPTHLEAESLSVSQPAGQAVDTPTVVDVVRNTNGTDRVTLGLQANPSGYHSDGEFGGAYIQLGGAYTQQVAGTHPLYDCLTGTDHFTSTSSGCENRTMVALIGYVYDTAQSDPPTSPIYRCRTSTDHFDTYWSNCGGATVESVLGYFLNTSGRAFSGKRAVTVAAGAVDQKVSLHFTASVTAYYALGIQLQTGNEGGQFAFTLDGDAAHPLANTDPAQHIGISTDSVFDEKYLPLGGQHFDAGSTHTIDLIVTSAGASTGGYRATVDFLSLIPLNNVSYPGLSEAMNNHGISADGTTANFDLNGGDALSLQALTAAGYGPGATVTAGSGADAATFTMPKPHLDSQGSTVDNVIATGQTIPLPHVKTSSVRMLVTSTCGSSAQADSVASSFHFKEVDDDPFSGSGAPRYQDVTMPTIPDWTSLDGVSSIPGGAQISLAVQLPYRNQFDGTKAWWSNVYLVSLPVDPTYTLDSVTLPDLGSDLLTCVGPTLHVLAMSVAAPADTVGIYRPSQTAFFLRQSDGSSAVLPFGAAGDNPISGDWDGDGSKTIGTYRPSNKTFHLSNSNTSEDQLVTVASAAAGDIPVAGDWDGDGKTTVGLYRPSTSVFYLINDLASPTTLITLGYGTAGDLPVVGDWDGNGTTTVGIWRASNLTFYIDNSNTSSATYTTVAMGVAGDLPVAGDWDGNGSSTVGVWRPSNTTFYLNNNQLASSTVTTIDYGLSGDAVTVVNKQG
jgi:hypothetical protein